MVMMIILMRAFGPDEDDIAILMRMMIMMRKMLMMMMIMVMKLMIGMRMMKVTAGPNLAPR